MSNPIILYDNRFEDGDLSATNTADGYDVNNIKDLRTHTQWKANAAGTLYITEAPLAKDAVTLADMRLSLVAGTAFVDFSTADILTDYIGKRLVIIDSAGKKAIGYIKAAGTGETYSATLLTNGAFTTNTDNWTPSSCTIASVAGGEAGNCLEITRVLGTNQFVSQTITTVVGGLVKIIAYLKSGTSGNETAYVILADGVTNLCIGTATSSGAWAPVSAYGTMTVIDPVFRLFKYTGTAGTMLWDTATAVKVLTPSATGVTIVSTPGGTTYNWESIESGFNYNDAAGYTYKISEADYADTLGIMGHNLGTAEALVSVESTDDESTWTERLAAFTPDNDYAILKTMTSFRAASKRLKIVTAATAPYIACALLGVRLEFAHGISIVDGPISPWRFGIIASSQISKTGNLLGNIIRYKPINISVTIPTDLYTWVNENYWPFWRDHGSNLDPFLYAPDLTTFTDKIFWLRLTKESAFDPYMLMKDRVDGYTFEMEGVLEE